jgi:hypothetical protein
MSGTLRPRCAPEDDVDRRVHRRWRTRAALDAAPCNCIASATLHRVGAVQVSAARASTNRRRSPRRRARGRRRAASASPHGPSRGRGLYFTDTMGRAIVAAAVVGLFGLLGGSCFGPSYFSVDGIGTAAPLNGIFLSGPVGVMLGALLGAAASLRNWRSWVFAGVLVLVAVGVLLGGMALNWPESYVEGRQIEGEISACRSPLLLRDEAVSQWRKTLSSEQWMKPRPGWEADLDRLIAHSDGVVLTVKVRKRRDFYQHREPWRYGRVDPTGWRRKSNTEEFFARFAGPGCTAYRLGERRYFMEESGEISGEDLPHTLPRFLDLHVITPVAPEWRPPT